MAQMPDKSKERKARRRKAAAAGVSKASEGAAPIEHDKQPATKLGGVSSGVRSGREHMAKPSKLASRRQHRGGK